MHSMLRQNQIRLQDVKPYVRSFDRKNPVLSPQEWATQEGCLFDAGMLVFLLEPARRPPGLSSFANRQQEADAGTGQDLFRVKDLSIILDKIEGKSWALNITPSAYERRFLDALFRDKATKSVLDGIDFNYLVARPRQALSRAQIKELAQMSEVYKDGGSRRTLAQEGDGPEEPARALLSFLGVDWSSGGTKPVIEIGTICHLIFSPETQQEHPLRHELKSHFLAMLTSEKLADATAQSAPGPQPIEAVPMEALDPGLVMTEFLPSCQDLEPLPSPSQASEALVCSTLDGLKPVQTSGPGADFSAISALPPELAGLGQADEPAFPLAGPESVDPFAPVESQVQAQPQSLVSKQAPDLDSSNGTVTEDAVPVPAWYLLSHDIESMNTTAAEFFRAFDQEPAQGLESQPVPNMVQTSVAPIEPKVDYSLEFFADYEKGLAGAQAVSKSETQVAREQTENLSARQESSAITSADIAAQKEEFIDSIFESTGAKSTIEVNPEAKVIEPPAPEPLPAPTTQLDSNASSEFEPIVPLIKDQEQSDIDSRFSRPISSPATSFEAFTESASRIEPLKSPLEAPDNSADTNRAPRESSGLFERLTDQLAEEQLADEQLTPPAPLPTPQPVSDSKPQGPPTNLMDMLTADSEVFSTQGPNKADKMSAEYDELAEALNGLIDNNARQASLPVPAFEQVSPGDPPPPLFVIEPEAPVVTSETADPTVSGSSDILAALDEMNLDAELESVKSEPISLESLNKLGSDLLRKQATEQDDSDMAPVVPELSAEMSFQTQEMSSFVPELHFSVKEEDEEQVQALPATAEIAPESAFESAFQPDATPVPEPEPEPEPESEGEKEEAAPQVFAMPGPTIDSQIFAMPGPVLEESVVEESGDNEPVELPPAPAFFATSAPDKAPPVQVEVFEPQAEEFPMRIEEQPVIAEPQIQPQAQGAPMPQPALQAETPATPMTDEIGTPSLLMEPVDTPQSGLSQAPVEAKLVLSESARFMARLNQRLSEAEKKLDSKSDQAIMRLTDAVLDLSSLGESIEKEREKSSKDLAVTYWQHLESVVEQVKKRISEASESARLEFDAFFMEARTAVEDMNQELISTLRYADHRAQSDSEAHTTATRENIDQHIEEKVEEYNTRTEVVCELLDSTAQYYLKQLHERFQRFRSRMDEELNSISSSLDRNVRSMTEEIDGSWDRASEKLRSSHEEFEQTTNHLVRNCQLEIDREIKGACVEQILPKILENKAIFRAMLADMHRNFEEQSAKIIDEHLIGLEKNIESAKAELNRVVYKCLTDIEQVGKGHRDGLDELFNTTDKRLIEMTSEVESKLEGSRIEIVRNQEACNQLTEYATTEEDSSLSKERKKTKATLSEVRNTADNTLETAIGSSCLHLDQLGEQLGRDLTKTRLDWTNQVKTTGDEGTASIRKALQEAFQAIEIAREKYME